MKKIWELYIIAISIIKKLCERKCHHLGRDGMEMCYDYVVRRLEKNEFQSLKNYDSSRGVKESTYLHMLISSRIIDFFNSSTYQREFSDIDSIRDKTIETTINDYAEILNDIFNTLTYEERSYLKYRYNDELSYKEIGKIFMITDKQASKKLENIQIKLKKKLLSFGLSLEDILL